MEQAQSPYIKTGISKAFGGRGGKLHLNTVVSQGSLYPPSSSFWPCIQPLGDVIHSHGLNDHPYVLATSTYWLYQI